MSSVFTVHASVFRVRIQGQVDSYSGHACLNKMQILPKSAKMHNGIKTDYALNTLIQSFSQDSAQCLTDFHHFVKIINYSTVTAVPVFPLDKMTVNTL